MVEFTPYYNPSPPLWEVVANSISYFWEFLDFQKGCIPLAVRSLLSAEPILVGTSCLLVLHLLLEIFHRFHPDTVTIVKVLTCISLLLRVWHNNGNIINNNFIKTSDITMIELIHNTYVYYLFSFSF